MFVKSTPTCELCDLLRAYGQHQLCDKCIDNVAIVDDDLDNNLFYDPWEIK